MTKIALITGITGMDSSHLAEFLLEQGYKVYGTLRRSSTDNTWRIKKIIDKIEIVNTDLTDGASLNKAIQLIQPDEVYNLAAQSYVRVSWDSPESTLDINGMGVVRLLEAIRLSGNKNMRMYQASSSEQFGKVQETPQTETTPFYPRSPYGVSKCFAHWACVNWRESYNMFVSCGISFNHDGARRGLEFVSRKIAYNVAKIKLGLAKHIQLGNLDSQRDFGYAPEFCQAFWKILQLDKPDDFVLSTGETHSIKEFVQEAFRVVGIVNWEDYVVYDEKMMRPAEVNLLLGDSRKAREAFGWQPKVLFKELVAIMVQSDLERLESGARYD